MPGLTQAVCVCCSEMFQYISTLRSMTKGRAQYTMVLDRYEPVPNHIQEKIIQEFKGVTA